MKIEIIEINKNGCSTVFKVNSAEFSTSCWGDGLFYNGREILPTEFFSLNQNTRSGRWKAIKRQFKKYSKLIREKVNER